MGGRRSPVRQAIRLTLGGAAVGQVALLVSGVFAARILGPQARGELALLLLLQVVVGQFGLLGLPFALTYEIARAPKESSAIVRRLTRPVALQIALLTGSTAVLVTALTLGPWSGFAAPALVSVASLPGGAATVLWPRGIAGAEPLPAFQRAPECAACPIRGWRFGPVRRGGGTLMALTVCWVVSTTVAGFTSLRVALTRTCRADATQDAGLIPRMVRFGLKGLLGSASPIETFRLDQAIVGPFLSTSALGLYVAGLSFSNLPRVIGQSVGIVAYPHVAASAPDARRRAMFRAILFAALACGAPVAVLLPSMGFLVPLLSALTSDRPCPSRSSC